MGGQRHVLVYDQPLATTIMRMAWSLTVTVSRSLAESGCLCKDTDSELDFGGAGVNVYASVANSVVLGA